MSFLKLGYSHLLDTVFIKQSIYLFKNSSNSWEQYFSYWSEKKGVWTAKRKNHFKWSKQKGTEKYLIVYVGRKTLNVDSIENIDIQRNSFGPTAKNRFFSVKTKSVGFI